MRTESFKMDRAVAQWAFTRSRGYESGTILLPEGVVSVLIQGDDEHLHLTRLDTVIDGRQVIRTWRRRYTKRGVIKLARQLLTGISENSE